MSSDGRYALLVSDELEYLDNRSDELVPGRTRRSCPVAYWSIIGIQSFGILVLVSIVWSRTSHSTSSQLLYCTYIRLAT